MKARAVRFVGLLAHFMTQPFVNPLVNSAEAGSLATSSFLFGGSLLFYTPQTVKCTSVANSECVKADL